LSNGWSYHPWRIENKYYCADVKLVVVANHEEKCDWLTRKELEITAIVIAFDQVQVGYVNGAIFCNLTCQTFIYTEKMWSLQFNRIAQCC
jgi:hypothetical protein